MTMEREVRDMRDSWLYMSTDGGGSWSGQACVPDIGERGNCGDLKPKGTSSLQGTQQGQCPPLHVPRRPFLTFLGI